MFKVAFYALILGLVSSTALTLFVVTLSFRKQRALIQSLAALVVFSVLLIPCVLASAYVLEWWWTHRGVAGPARVDAIMAGLGPPESASNVHYLKTTAFETWTCELPEVDVVAWCQGHALTADDPPHRPGYNAFKHSVPQDVDADLQFESERAPNGAGFTVWYFRSAGVLVYEAGYW